MPLLTLTLSSFAPTLQALAMAAQQPLSRSRAPQPLLLCSKLIVADQVPHGNARRPRRPLPAGAASAFSSGGTGAAAARPERGPGPAAAPPVGAGSRSRPRAPSPEPRAGRCCPDGRPRAELGRGEEQGVRVPPAAACGAVLRDLSRLGTLRCCPRARERRRSPARPRWDPSARAARQGNARCRGAPSSAVPAAPGRGVPAGTAVPPHQARRTTRCRPGAVGTVASNAARHSGRL